MTLIDAVTHAIEERGIEILKNRCFFNILDDLGAFKNERHLRSIVKYIVENDYLKQIRNLDSTNWFTKVFDSSDLQSRKQSLVKKLNKNALYSDSDLMYVIESIYNGINKVTKKDNTNTENLVQDNAVSDSNSLISPTQFLVINDIPKDAELSIDGKIKQYKGNSYVVEVPIGKHTINAKYKNHIISEIIDVCKTSNCIVTLEKRYRVVFIVKGATEIHHERYTIEKDSASTDRFVGYFPAGYFAVRIKSPYHSDNVQSIVVKTEETDQTITLSIGKRLSCKLKFDSCFQGIPIYEGAHKPTTPLASTPVVLNSFPCGKYKIVLFSNYHERCKKELELREGTYSVNFDDIIQYQKKNNLNEPIVYYKIIEIR